MLWLLPLLLLAPATTPATPVALPVAATLAEDSETRWVPFTITSSNHLRFTASINGTPATALLDTGVSQSVVSRGAARRLRLPTLGTGSAITIGGSVDVGFVGVDTLAIGGLTRSGGRLAAVDLSTVPGDAAAADLLVGADLLSAWALDLDFPNRRFRLLPSGRMPFTGRRAPLRLADGGGLYLTEGTLGRRRVRPLLIDTGDGGAMTVTPPIWRAARAAHAGVTSTVAYGLGTTLVAGLAVTEAAAIGDVATGPIEVRIEDSAAFADRTGTAGRLGTAFLQRYRVLLDPRAGHMLLSPGPAADTPPLRSTSGLLLGYRDRRLDVLHVMRGSPAAAAGWKAGEQICTVEGAPVLAVGSTRVDLGWAVAAPGTRTRLGLCDGTERQLTARAFY